MVPHLARVQDGHDALAKLGDEGIGHDGGGHDEARLGSGDGVKHHDGGGVRRESLASLGLDDGVVVSLAAADVGISAAGDELDGLHGGEVVERGELLAHVNAVAAEGHSLGEESTLRSLGGAGANLAGARHEGDDVTALGAVAEIHRAVRLGDAAREGAGREHRLEQGHRLGVGARGVNNRPAVAAAEEFLDPGADFVDENDVGGLLALPEAVKHLLGRLERARGRGRGGAGATVEKVGSAGVHAGEVLVEAALAVEDGAVVAALLHEAHGGFLDDLGLDRADQGAEILDGVVQGHGQREHDLGHHHAGRVGHEIHEAFVALCDAPGDAEHVVQAFHAGRAHEEANAVDVAVAVDLLRVEAKVLGREQELLEDGRLRQAVAAPGLLAGDRGALRGTPEVGRDLHDVAEAGDSHGVADADSDLRLAAAVGGDGVHPDRDAA